jgi:hypothetical protein
MSKEDVELTRKLMEIVNIHKLNEMVTHDMSLREAIMSIQNHVANNERITKHAIMTSLTVVLQLIDSIEDGNYKRNELLNKIL